MFSKATSTFVLGFSLFFASTNARVIEERQLDSILNGATSAVGSAFNQATSVIASEFAQITSVAGTAVKTLDGKVQTFISDEKGELLTLAQSGTVTTIGGTAYTLAPLVGGDAPASNGPQRFAVLASLGAVAGGIAMGAFAL